MHWICWKFYMHIKLGISIVGRGFHLFVKTSGNLSIGVAEQMAQNNMFTSPVCWRTGKCILYVTENQLWPIKTLRKLRTCVLVHKKQLWPIQIVSEHWSMSFERANIIPQNSFAFEEIDSVSRIHRICRRRKPSLHQEKDNHKVTRWIFFLKLLCGWDLPSSREVHTDQGKTLLRRLCVQVGAASQISWMLTEDICS